MEENKGAGTWPRDADDLVNGIPETTKAAKSMGHVPGPGNDPDAQLRAAKGLSGLGIEVPAGIQSGPVMPEDRRAAVQRQNEYAESKVPDLLASDTPNAVQAAKAAEEGNSEVPDDDDKNDDDNDDKNDDDNDDKNDGKSAAERAAEQRRAVTPAAATRRPPAGRQAPPQTAG